MIKTIKLYINPKNWFYWLNSKLRQYYTPKDMYEFYVYIANRSATCPDCVKAGRCLDCTCKTPDLFFEKKDCKNFKHN